MNTRPTWDDTFIDLCFSIAKRSKDRSTKMGAVVVGPNKEPRSMGYNGFPRNCNDDIEERHLRPKKYLFSAHSEQNCIFNAARVGVKLEGCIMYIGGPPCADCARAIIQVGILEVVCASTIAPRRWRDSCDASLEMLTEAGIMVRLPNSPDRITCWQYPNQDGWGDDRNRP